MSTVNKEDMIREYKRAVSRVVRSLTTTNGIYWFYRFVAVLNTAQHLKSIKLSVEMFDGRAYGAEIIGTKLSASEWSAHEELCKVMRDIIESVVVHEVDIALGQENPELQGVQPDDPLEEDEQPGTRSKKQGEELKDIRRFMR